MSKHLRFGMPHSKIHPYSSAGQCVTLILSALNELRGICTKQETIDYIGAQHWFAMQDEGHRPYPSNHLTTKEPRWKTLLAWGRKNGFQREWLMPHFEKDCWEISRNGTEKLNQICDRYQDAIYRVEKCYLWTAAYKRKLDPLYVESQEDAIRPVTMYRDVFEEHVLHDII